MSGRGPCRPVMPRRAETGARWGASLRSNSEVIPKNFRSKLTLSSVSGLFQASDNYKCTIWCHARHQPYKLIGFDDMYVPNPINS